MNKPNKPRSGFTLVEALMAMSCGSLMLAAVITSGIALQRSFFAVEGYSVAESDQLRVSDYIAMDGRRATKVTVASNVLTFTLPVYYDNGNAPQAPTLSGGVLTYGSGSIEVSYAQNGSFFDRTIKKKDSGGTVTSTYAKHIATNVSTFNVTPVDQSLTDGTVTCSITFSPRFTYLPGPGPVAGTTVYCSTFLRNAGARQ